MRLTELEPDFLRYEKRPDGVYHIRVDSLGAAQGVMFLCPRCFAANHGPVGTHMIGVWFRDRGVPDDAVPGPARWAVSGSGYADLTLSPSILLTSGCLWHGWVTAGEVT